MLLAQAHEQLVQRLPADLVLVVHAGDQLGHDPEPAVQVDGVDVDRVVHESSGHIRSIPVPEPDAEKVEHVLGLAHQRGEREYGCQDPGKRIRVKEKKGRKSGVWKERGCAHGQDQGYKKGHRKGYTSVRSTAVSFQTIDDDATTAIAIATKQPQPQAQQHRHQQPQQRQQRQHQTTQTTTTATAAATHLLHEGAPLLLAEHDGSHEPSRRANEPLREHLPLLLSLPAVQTSRTPDIITSSTTPHHVGKDTVVRVGTADCQLLRTNKL